MAKELSTTLRKGLKRAVLGDGVTRAMAATDYPKRIVPFRGAKILCGMDNKIERKLLEGDGSYDSELFDIVEAMVNPGDVCFDIGANIGVYTAVLGAIAGAQGSVHAFEPVWHIADKNTVNYRINGLRNVRLNRFVLGDTDGTISMRQIRPGQFRAGTSTLTNNENVAALGEAAFEVRDVQMTTLDGYCRENAIKRLDFVKLDVEGFELNVLSGAAHTLNSLKPIVIFEHNQKRLAHLKLTEDKFAEIFRAAKYQCYEIRNVDGEVLLVPYAFDRTMLGTNLLAVSIG